MSTPFKSLRPLVLATLLPFGWPADLTAQGPNDDVELPGRLGRLGSGTTPREFDDAVTARRESESALKAYYMNPNARYGLEMQNVDYEECVASSFTCFFNDPDLLSCNHIQGDGCRAREQRATAMNRVVATLRGAAIAAPTDVFVVQQAVYSLVKAGLYSFALDLAWDCQLEGWRCSALEGYVLYRGGEQDPGGRSLLNALEAAPDSVACRWRDIEPLLPEDARESYGRSTCAERRVVEDRAWWLADPIWADEANDRFIHHLYRRVGIDLHEQLWTLGEEPIVTYMPYPGAPGFSRYFPHTDWREYDAFDDHISHHELDQSLGGHHRGVLAIGWPDSWWHRGGSPRTQGRYFHWRQWVSEEAARYRFFPAAPALADPSRTSRTDWDFEAGEGWERYTPSYATFSDELPFQRAFFLRGDSVEMALATDVDSDPAWAGLLRVAGLILREDFDEPETPLILMENRPSYRFRTRLPARPMVASLEIIGESRISRIREAVQAPWAPSDPIRVSDLLLFEPRGIELAETMESAVSQMIGTTTLNPARELALYFEIYDLEEGETVDLDLSFVQPDGGLLDRVGRGLGIGDRQSRELSWSDTPLEAGILPRSLELDLNGLESGEWIMRLTIQVPGRGVVVRERRLFIEEGEDGGIDAG